MSGKTSPAPTRCRRGHPKYDWDPHNLCIGCRVSDNPRVVNSSCSDPCCKGLPCEICESFTGEQISILANRRSYRSRSRNLTPDSDGRVAARSCSPISIDCQADRSRDRACSISGAGGARRGVHKAGVRESGPEQAPRRIDVSLSIPPSQDSYLSDRSLRLGHTRHREHAQSSVAALGRDNPPGNPVKGKPGHTVSRVPAQTGQTGHTKIGSLGFFTYTCKAV